MPKNLIKRYMPDNDTIRTHKQLRFFGKLLGDPNLWHLNRRSVAGDFGVGLFMAFVPLPTQMIFAAAAAIVLRVNLPLSVSLVWITNPLTMGPMFYGAYRLGAWLLQVERPDFGLNMNFETLLNHLSVIWQPLLLGSFICAVISALLGYYIIQSLWRLRIANHKRRRRAQRHRIKD